MMFGRPAKRLVGVALAMMALAAAAMAADPPPFEVSLGDRDAADLERIERYLNGIRTMDSRFLQVSSDGDHAEGRLYLSRPGRMRIEYDPPPHVLIVAAGNDLVYHDRELNQTTHVFPDDTPAGLLLDETIAFDDDRVTLTAFERGGGVIRVTLVKSKDPQAGTLTLVFGDRPLILRKWTVRDAQGLETHVSLVGARFGMPLDDGLFQFRPPERDDQRD